MIIQSSDMEQSLICSKYGDFCIQQRGRVVIGFLLAGICLLAVIRIAGSKKNKRRVVLPPEPAGAWPFIGHIHLLWANLLHQTLGGLADKYGPVFSIRIGIHRTLVISHLEVAKECFTTLDKVFPTRPKSWAVKIMGYNHAMLGLAPYGPYWREIRKLAIIELLSNHRLEMLKHVRNTEVNFLIQELYEKWLGNGGREPVLVEMREKFGDLTMKIVVRMVAGKRYFGSSECSSTEESRQFQKAMGSFLHFIGLFMISDAIPFLGWLDTAKGYTGEMKRTAKNLDLVLQAWVEEHRQRREVGSIDESEQDIIHAMLSSMDGDQFFGADADTVVKATCMSLILGGHETNMIALTWALSLLLNNRHVLRKAQDELDINIGKHRQVKEHDIKNLVYLQAIVKETLRLYPPLPLSVPHEAMEDCTVAGFHVPAGTRLFVNIWKLHHDPSIWSDPLAFKPERFLTQHAHLDVRGQDFELIPFGSGRRSCPGITFALQVLHLTLAKLLHMFELGTISESPVDMTECSGMSVPKATPLEVTFTPRLPSTLYK